jgi:competence protein ComEC
MPLVWLSLAFLGGLLLGSQQIITNGYWPLGTGIVLFLLGLVEYRQKENWFWAARWHRISPLPAGVLGAFFLFGLARFIIAQPVWGPTETGWYVGRGEVQVVGVTVTAPEIRSGYAIQELAVEKISYPSGQAPIKVQGKLLMRLNLNQANLYGERLELKGELQLPSEELDSSYQASLSARNIQAVLYYPQIKHLAKDQGNPFLALLYTFRDHAARLLRQLIPEPEAALLSGILLGQDQDLPPNLSAAFQATGTTHLIAISGFNIAVLSALIMAFSKRLFRLPWSLLVCLVLLAVYSVLVGASASVIRAAVMGGVGLIGREIGRRQAGVNSLSLTAALMALSNPWLVWDAGFQLSFSATLGLIWFAEPLQTWLAERAGWMPAPLLNFINDYLLTTSAAQITTLPIILYQFKRFSAGALLANLLVLPPQPGVMVIGGTALLSGLIFLPAGQVVAWLAWPLLAYTNRMVELLARLPGSAIQVEFGLPAVLVCYVVIILIAVRTDLPVRLASKIRPGLLLGLLALITGVVWQAAFAQPDQKLHLVIFDMPGNPALLTTPSGNTLLINSTSSAAPLASELSQRMSIFNRKLNAVLLPTASGSNSDSLPEVLERFPPDTVLLNRSSSPSRRLVTFLDQQQTPNETLEPGQVLACGDNILIRVLSSAAQPGILLEWGNFRAYWPAGNTPNSLSTDTSAQGITLLALSNADLKYAKDWLALQPNLITAPGSDQGTNWLGLDRHQWVEVRTDSRQLWVESGK